MVTLAARMGDRFLEGTVRCRVLFRRTLGWTVREDGAVAAEYALILSLVAVVIVIAVTAFGISVASLFDRTRAVVP